MVSEEHLRGDFMNVHDFMNTEGNTYAITNAIAKTWDILGRYEKPMVSVSGGSDSDIVVDMISKLDTEKKVRYGWFNTGIELEASKRHLRFLEEKYGITIETLPIVHPIAYTVKKYGYPFLGKYISYAIDVLQRHGYDFRLDGTYEDDLKEFQHCKDGIDWWYNKHLRPVWNVSHHRYLRQFLGTYPPTFPISDKCCHYSKKLPSEKLMRSGEFDLTITGLRKAEGGVRMGINQCFAYSERRGARFMPILYFSNDDKQRYNEIYGVTNSEVYTVYGFRRTGCSGCPFNPRLMEDRDKLCQYEPGLVKAADNIFAPSYEYTRLYMRFCEAQYVLDGRVNQLSRLFRH